MKANVYSLIEGDRRKINREKTCMIIRHFHNHGDLINQIMIFLNKSINCQVIRKHIITQCGTTQDSLSYILTNGIKEKIPLVNDKLLFLSGDVIIDFINSNDIFGFGIPNKGEFPGHVFMVYKLSDDSYLVIQSYVGHYKVLYNIGTKGDIINLIYNYMAMYDINKRTLSFSEIWYKLTGVRINMESDFPQSFPFLISYNFNEVPSCERLGNLYLEALDKIRNILENEKGDVQDVPNFIHSFLYWDKKTVHIDDLVYISMKIEEAYLVYLNQLDSGMQVGGFYTDGYPIINYI